MESLEDIDDIAEIEVKKHYDYIVGVGIVLYILRVKIFF
jgi:hypothetical protein